MSTVDTKALRALLEKATPGPWASSYYGDGQYVITMPRDRSVRFHPRPPSGADHQSATVYGASGFARELPGGAIVGMNGHELDGLTEAEYAAQRVADGMWIIALVNAAPALLDAADERDALRAENERLREAARAVCESTDASAVQLGLRMLRAALAAQERKA